jgi:uncharacterized OB-fold protein
MDFDLLKTPGPTITALTAPFWEAASQGRLIIQHCDDCGESVFYPRPVCPHCWSDWLRWKDASGSGRLKSFSVIHKPGHPGWQPIAPFTVGLVELAEGPTMLSFIHEPADGNLTVGDPLKLKPTKIAGRVLPAFERIKI